MSNREVVLQRHAHGRAGIAVLTALLLTGCAQKMDVAPRYSPLSAASFFGDGQSARPIVEGTIPRGGARADGFLYEGRVGGVWVDSFPFPVTAQVMRRGRERFEIFCAPCHGRAGDGQGVVVQRGLRGPVSFHEKRFIEYPAGYFFDVITHGRGAMYPYASRIPVADRWAIVAYLRALQLSANATAGDVPPDQLQRLEEGVR